MYAKRVVPTSWVIVPGPPAVEQRFENGFEGDRSQSYRQVLVAGTPVVAQVDM